MCRHALNVLDPDGPPPPEDTAAKVGLTFGKTRTDGLTPFKGICDPETRAALQAALAPLAKPVKSEHGTDTRTLPTRMHDALRDLALRALAGGDLPPMAGLPATLLLTTTLEQFEARTGLVSVLNGGTLPVEDVIRLAANMHVVPIVYSAAGEVLYCGQEQRLATTALRYATASQDLGCVIPGCDAPLSSARCTTRPRSAKVVRPPPRTSPGSAPTTTDASTAGPCNAAADESGAPHHPGSTRPKPHDSTPTSTHQPSSTTTTTEPPQHHHEPDRSPHTSDTAGFETHQPGDAPRVPGRSACSAPHRFTLGWPGLGLGSRTCPIGP